MGFCVIPVLVGILPPGWAANLEEEKEVHLQKRMVDFVKRRVLVLEKVLNAEYHRESLVRGDSLFVIELVRFHVLLETPSPPVIMLQHFLRLKIYRTELSHHCPP
jgi:hypothetical protein